MDSMEDERVTKTGIARVDRPPGCTCIDLYFEAPRKYRWAVEFCAKGVELDRTLEYSFYRSPPPKPNWRNRQSSINRIALLSLRSCSLFPPFPKAASLRRSPISPRIKINDGSPSAKLSPTNVEPDPRAPPHRCRWFFPALSKTHASGTLLSRPRSLSLSFHSCQMRRPRDPTRRMAYYVRRASARLTRCTECTECTKRTELAKTSGGKAQRTDSFSVY